jgi:hypothetical protein
MSPAIAVKFQATANHYRNYQMSRNAGNDRGINALWNAGGLMYAPPVK